MEHSQHKPVVMGSPKGFGQVFAVVFVLVALWPLWHGHGPRLWALAVAAIFLGLAYAAPQVLQPLNKLWFRFGLLLSRVMTPLVMSLMYALAVVPTGLALRAFGKDPLSRTANPAAATYWISRKDAPVGSMRNQF